MNWQAICDNPSFQNIPFKFETNRWGKIVMSPASNRHSRYQGLIGRLLDRFLTDGEAIPECSIQTADGVMVADVAWASAEFLQRHGIANPYPEAPEIVIEILLPSKYAGGDGGEKRTLFRPWGAGILDLPGRWCDAVLQ